MLVIDAKIANLSPKHKDFATFALMTTESLKQRTAKGLFWGGVSNGGQQLLNALFGIFLARLLSPADYGMVGMLTIFSLIAVSLQESGFISALNRKKEARAEDYNAVFWFNVLCSTTVYVLLFFLAPLIAQWFRQPVLVPLARLSFLSFVISSFATTPRAWLFRTLRVKQTAVITMVALVASGVTGVTLAWNGFAYWGIAIQNLTYCLFITLGSWWAARWRPSIHIDLRPLRGMIGFSSKLLATNIFTHINNNLFSLFFGRLYGERMVGYYNQANKWTGMGYNTLTGMVWSVTQPLFARLSYDDPQRMRYAFRKMLRLTCFLSFPALFGLGLIAPEFITLTITEKWLPSASLMQLLCVGGAFMPVASFYANFVISQGKSNVFMYNTMAQCLVQMLCMVVLYPYGVEAMVEAYVAINVVWVAVWHAFVRHTVKTTFTDALRDITPFMLVAAVAMAAGWAAAQPVADCTVLSLVAKVVVAAAVYVGLMWLFGAAIMRECIAFVRHKGH